MSRVEGENLLRKSVEIAREARDIYYDRAAKGSRDTFGDKDEIIPRKRPVLVAASVGSYGAYLADGSEYRFVKWTILAIRQSNGCWITND